MNDLTLLARRLTRLLQDSRASATRLKRWDLRLQAKGRAEAYACALEHVQILQMTVSRPGQGALGCGEDRE